MVGNTEDHVEVLGSQTWKIVLKAGAEQGCLASSDTQCAQILGPQSSKGLEVANYDSATLSEWPCPSLLLSTHQSPRNRSLGPYLCIGYTREEVAIAYHKGPQNEYFGFLDHIGSLSPFFYSESHRQNINKLP